MDAKARRAWGVIQACAAAQRYVVLPHFLQRLDHRGFFWPNIQAVIDDPIDVRFDGRDKYDRPKWIITGRTVDRVDIALVCTIDRDDDGNVIVFITIY
jgi:hypothetical protein